MWFSREAQDDVIVEPVSRDVSEVDRSDPGLRDERDSDPLIEMAVQRLRDSLEGLAATDEWGRPIAWRHVVRIAMGPLLGELREAQATVRLTQALREDQDALLDEHEDLLVKHEALLIKHEALLVAHESLLAGGTAPADATSDVPTEAPAMIELPETPEMPDAAAVLLIETPIYEPYDPAPYDGVYETTRRHLHSVDDTSSLGWPA